MIKVGKILGIMEIFLIFGDFWGFFLSTRSSSEHSDFGGDGGGWGLVGAGVSQLL